MPVSSSLDCSDQRGDGPRVLSLPRLVAQELVLLAVLCPLMATDLTASLSSTVFATDSSDKKGAFVAAEVPPDVARALWRSGRKKGGHTRLSPAQHPASRGYDVPRVYDPQDPKTLTGTTLALRSLSLLDVASDSGCPGLLEQPRRTKMRRLEEWQRLLELQRAHEVWTAGCMFGSIHNKEFVFLYCNLDGGKLHRKCDGGHQHVRIEGQYTKKSAVYPDELAEAIACEFDAALTRKLRYEGARDPQTAGLERPLCNEVLLGAQWRPVSVWTWKKPLHINILETRVVLALMTRLALSSPGVRQVVALDSNVGLSALAKGRSPSYGLRPYVRKTGATVVAGRIYPAYQFAPTRLNPADHPTRDNEMPEPSLSVLPADASLEELLDFAEVNMLSHPAANWIRLFTLVRAPPMSG